MSATGDQFPTDTTGLPDCRPSEVVDLRDGGSFRLRIAPVRKRIGDSIVRMLRSDTTVVHLVTLLEDMPVTETEEAIRDLTPTQIRVGSVIENMVRPTPLGEDQLRAAAAGSATLTVPGLTTQQNRALTASFALEAARTLSERERHQRLTALGLPLVEVALDPSGIDEAAVFAIAEQLRGQLRLEA